MVYVLIGVIILLINGLLLKDTETMKKMKASETWMKVVISLTIVFGWPVILVVEGIMFLVLTNKKTE